MDEFYINELGVKVPLKKRKLSELELEEISLVSKPSNKRKFLFYKGVNIMSTLDEIVNLIETIEKSVDLTKAEDAAVQDAILFLDDHGLEAAGPLLLLSKVLAKGHDSPKVKKALEAKWPSLSQGLILVNKAHLRKSTDHGIKPSDACPFPSLTQAFMEA